MANSIVSKVFPIGPVMFLQWAGPRHFITIERGRQGQLVLCVCVCVCVCVAMGDETPLQVCMFIR